MREADKAREAAMREAMHAQEQAQREAQREQEKRMREAERDAQKAMDQARRAAEEEQRKQALLRDQETAAGRRPSPGGEPAEGRPCRCAEREDFEQRTKDLDADRKPSRSVGARPGQPAPAAEDRARRDRERDAPAPSPCQIQLSHRPRRRGRTEEHRGSRALRRLRRSPIVPPTRPLFRERRCHRCPRPFR